MILYLQLSVCLCLYLVEIKSCIDPYVLEIIITQNFIFYQVWRQNTRREYMELILGGLSDLY